MMELYIKGKVENVVRGKNFVNKDTGEVRKGALRLQFIHLDDVRGLQTIDVFVPDKYESKAYELLGKEVSIPVNVFARNSKVFYRVKEL